MISLAYIKTLKHFIKSETSTSVNILPKRSQCSKFTVGGSEFNIFQHTFFP